MPGSAADPVFLDPWQDIVEVGWSDEEELTIGATLRKSNFFAGSETCNGDSMEAFNVNDHSGDYISIARLSADSVPQGAGFLGEIPVTFSGFNLGNVDHAFGEWEFASKAFDPDVQRRCTATGTEVQLKLNNVDGLDGAPSCRDLPGIGTGRVSSARTGAAVATGPSYSFGGGAAVEVGGEGRTWVVSSVSIVSDSTADFTQVRITMVQA